MYKKEIWNISIHLQKLGKKQQITPKIEEENNKFKNNN